MSERDRRSPARHGDPGRDDFAQTGRSSLADVSHYGALGIQYAGTIVVLGALGYWADTAFGTLPWFLIAGILLGSVGGFVSLVKKVPGPKPSRPAAARPHPGPPSDPEKTRDSR